MFFTDMFHVYKKQRVYEYSCFKAVCTSTSGAVACCVILTSILHFNIDMSNSDSFPLYNILQ